MTVAALLAEHGSPLWLADVDRVRERLAGFRAAWEAAWGAVEVAYSYKKNRTTAFLRALAGDGAAAEVVCAAECALARDVVGVPGDRITVNGPAKPTALLDRAAADGALVIADSTGELERLALAGVRRVGLRVGLPGPRGAPSRFGIPPRDVVAAGRRATALGLDLEVLSVRLVSTNLLPGALWGWPVLEALAPRGAGAAPTLVTGPLCLNVDVVHPAAELGELAPGDVVVARGVGAYQLVQSTQFGDLRPAVVARDGGAWRPHRRRETVHDLIRHDEGEPSWSE